MSNYTPLVSLWAKLTCPGQRLDIAMRPLRESAVVGRGSVLQVVGSLPAPGARLKSHALPLIPAKVYASQLSCLGASVQ